jgi:hypothetical protein
VDAKRGQVFLITGTQAVDLSGFGSGLNRFFTDHLAFEILRYFPDVPTDNHFTGIGLHGVFDSKYDRVLITKLDYVPKSKDVKYDAVNREFYVEKTYKQIAYSTTTSTTTSAGTTTSTTTSFGSTTTTTTLKPITIRERVYLTDETYFCNKSWTVSFNFNTKSWISFHSYIPNWYIGENNFFYSGLNGCCDDFEVIAGVPGPVPTTTTTSSTSTTSTSSTTTTTTTKNCNLAGTVRETNCTLSGTAVVTVPPPIPPCTRPDELIEDVFFTGYNIISPPSSVVSTGSQSAACNAVAYLNTFGGSYVNVVPTFLTIEYQGLYLGSKVFVTNGTTDCTTIPDGWYFTGASQAVNTVFQVVGGLIVFITNCTTTTTTSTSSSTTTTSSTSTTTSTSSTTTTTTTAIPVTTTTTSSSSSSTTTTTTTTGTPTTTTTTTTAVPPTTTTTTSSSSTSTTTSTSSTSTTSTSSTTTTTTTAIPITTTTTSSTSSSTTTTTTTALITCNNYNIEGAPSIDVEWIECDGTPNSATVTTAIVVCAQTGSVTQTGGAGNITQLGSCTSPTTTTTTTATPSCLCYYILNETGGNLAYEYYDCVNGYTNANLAGGANIRVCSSNYPSGTGLTIEPCTDVTVCSTSADCTGCTTAPITTTTTTTAAPNCSLAGTAVEEEPPPPFLKF